MKNKALKAEIEKHIEGLTRALRSYTDEPMYMSLTMFTRDKECIHEGDPDGIPDYISVRVHESDLEDVDNADCTIEMTERVYYSFDGFDELIRTVIPYYSYNTEADQEE